MRAQRLTLARWCVWCFVAHIVVFGGVTAERARRVDGRTLDALCATLEVGPGELLEYVPKKGRKS